jgi:DNA polymerase-3 subunit beta
MKAHVLQENLFKAIARAVRIISGKTQLPILQNLLLKTENGILRVTATNMETTISSLVGAKIEKEGEICVSAKLLADLVSSLPQETIIIEEKENQAHVSTSRTHAELLTFSPGEYPAVNLTIGKNPIKIDKKIMLDALSQTLYAAATDDGRPLLTGIKIVSQENGTVFAATDGYRLSVKNVGESTAEPFDLVVPARALTEVYKTLGEEKEDKPLILGKNSDGQLCLLVGDTIVIARLIDGEYPPYAKIIPKNHMCAALFDKNEFQQAVKSAAIFARDNANIIKMHLDQNGLVVSANTPQVGQNTVEVEAKVTGEGGDIAFNSRFLLDFLNNCQFDELLFEMTGSLNPGVFKKNGDDTFVHIIMPVRVQN